MDGSIEALAVDLSSLFPYDEPIIFSLKDSVVVLGRKVTQSVVVVTYDGAENRVTWSIQTWPFEIWSEKLAITRAIALSDERALIIVEHPQGMEALIMSLEDWQVQGRLFLTGQPLQGFGVCALTDDRVAMVGGHVVSSSSGNLNPDCSSEVLFLNTTSMQLQGSARVSLGRCFTTNTIFGLNDRTLLIVGGTPDRLIPELEIPEPGSDLPIFDIVSNGGETTKSGVVKEARFWPASFRLENGDVVMAGGGVVDPSMAPPGSLAYLATKSVEIFDHRAQEFRSAKELPWPLSCATVVALKDGRYAIVGGGQNGIDDPTGLEIDQTLVFQPDTEMFEPGPRLRFPRIAPCCVALGNAVIVFGGEKRKLTHGPDWEILEF